MIEENTKEGGILEFEDGFYIGELNSRGEASGEGIFTDLNGTMTRGYWVNNVMILKIGKSFTKKERPKY